jgi:hypothetical protein
MNRGIGHRPIFENANDVRVFLLLLALAVRDGLLRVHAYVVLTTHYHLLVESLTGELARAMQRVQEMYAQYFNRTRGRDGHVFRGRYRSKLVSSLRYRLAVLAYIDRNPVDAGLASHPSAYRHGSAFHYSRKDCPAWIHRDYFSAVLGAGDRDHYDPKVYLGFLSSPGMRRTSHLVEAMLADPTCPEPPIDDLLAAAPEFMRRWLAGNARSADGLSIGTPLVHPRTVEEAIEAVRPSEDACVVRAGGPERDAWDLARAGLLRTISGLTIREIAARLGLSYGTTHALVHEHADALEADPEYGRIAARIVSTGLGLDYPVPTPRTAAGA